MTGNIESGEVVVINNISRETTMTGNIESGEVVAAIHSLILRQGDAGRFQVRNNHIKHGAGDDAKAAINIERCDLEAFVEGLSARRFGAEVIVPIQKGEIIRGDIIDGGVPAVKFDNLKVTQARSIQSLKLVHKTSEVIGRSLLDLVRFISLVLNDLGYVDLGDQPSIVLRREVKGAVRIFILKVQNQ